MGAQQMIDEAQFLIQLRRAVGGSGKDAPEFGIGTITSLSPLEMRVATAKTSIPCWALTSYTPSLGDQVVYTRLRKQIIVHGTVTDAALTVASSTYLAVANNLADVANAATARTNLGLGSAATASSTAFDAAGAAAAVAATVTAETTRAEAAESSLSSRISAETTRAETAEALLAPQASPTFTGHVTVPTPTTSTDASTKAYVDAETTRAEAAEATKLTASLNLSDVANASTARANLGVPGIAVAMALVFGGN